MDAVDIDRFWAQVDKSGGCWTWTGGLMSAGYGNFRLAGQMRGAHRVAWELTNGPVPGEMWVLHTCDNPPCVNPSHLWLGTARDNNRDCLVKGRHGSVTHPESQVRGRRAAAAKLTERDVVAIRTRFRSGETSAALSRSFGVTRAAVRKVVLRRSWAHVGEQVTLWTP
jgi:hypothetical protein